MPQFTLRQPVAFKVTETRGFVTEIHTKDQSPPLYRVLHLASTGDRLSTWVPEYELEALPAGEYPPFPDPFVTASEEI